MDFVKAMEILEKRVRCNARVNINLCNGVSCSECDYRIEKVGEFSEALETVFMHYVKTGDAVSGSLIDKSVCKYHLPCGLCEKGIYRVCRLDRKEAEHENSERTGIS